MSETRQIFLEFEWDPEKAWRNFQKHRVSFREGVMVFGDSFALTYYDDIHSLDDDRFITIGTSDRGRVLVVSHTDAGERIRIISARKATRRERELYEEETK